MTKKIVNWTTA